ncbi:MAG: glycosyl hydrolase, partial [Candidatus Cryptobacteroides sp.]
MKNSFLYLSLAIVLLSGCGRTDKSLVELEEGFRNPPSESRPQVWWHWMNGNISKDGIRKDILWMHDSGISGFHHFDAALDSEQIVAQRLIYMDDGWKDAFRYAITLADSLGMPVTIASSPGWSTTGGPWVKAGDAMKKVVWRKVRVEGGRYVSIDLPEGYNVAGSFLNRANGAKGTLWYEDIAVLAVRLDDEDRTLEERGARVSSDAAVKLEDMVDDDLTTGARASWIMYSFDEPQCFCSATVADQRERNWWRNEKADTSAVLESSEDGVNFTEVTRIPSNTVSYQVVSFPSVTAKYFRLRYPSSLSISEYDLSSQNRVMLAPEKAAFTSPADLHDFPTPYSEGAPEPVDLTAFVRDGKLEWDAPQGKWMVYRFGASCTGKENHPAPKEATGLEVDKLDADAWLSYFRNYLDMYKEASGALMGERGIQYLLTDSYEAQLQNWTPKMSERFLERNGYDMRPWLPALAGVIIGDSEQTERFLWDYRMTIGQLFAENYCRLNDIVEEYGMRGRYTEAHENGREFVMDGMDIKKTAQIPMSATWVPFRIATGTQGYMADADVRESASVSHLYGQRYVACESLTVPGDHKRAYSFCPENLKPTIDQEFAAGANRIVIHESAHQPRDDKFPGLGLLGYGQWFNRHETWAHLARVWTDYIARTSFLLQQGRFVGDILVYYGEDSSVCAEYGITPPSLPRGYAYDYVGPGCLMDLSSKGGKIVAPSGSSYEVLVLGNNTDIMSVKVLRKLAGLVDDGVRIVGSAPTRMAGNSGTVEEFNSLVGQIWCGGRVFQSVEEALSYCARDVDAPEAIDFVHRDIGKIQAYWLSNSSEMPISSEISFRVSGQEPRCWNPETGEISDVTYRISDGRTYLSLEMQPHDAFFIVFSGKAGLSGNVVHRPETSELFQVTGPWEVSFQEDRGAPESIVMERLSSLTESDIPGVRYFSGTAVYKTKVSLPCTDAKLMLDLGCVKNLAEV